MAFLSLPFLLLNSASCESHEEAIINDVLPKAGGPQDLPEGLGAEVHQVLSNLGHGHNCTLDTPLPILLPYTRVQL